MRPAGIRSRSWRARRARDPCFPSPRWPAARRWKKCGSPLPRCTSTSTRGAASPSCARLATRAMPMTPPSMESRSLCLAGVAVSGRPIPRSAPPVPRRAFPVLRAAPACVPAPCAARRIRRARPDPACPDWRAAPRGNCSPGLRADRKHRMRARGADPCIRLRSNSSTLGISTGALLTNLTSICPVLQRGQISRPNFGHQLASAPFFRAATGLIASLRAGMEPAL